MLAVGAPHLWFNSPAPADPLRVNRIPLLAAALCFATGDILARRWHGPLALAAATALLLALTFLSLRLAPRIALLPALALWIAAGCWCAQIQPPIPRQQALQHFADGLSRTVRGRVVRIRTLPSQQPTPTQPELEPGAWEPDPAPPIQSIDLDILAVEAVTPDTSTMQPTTGGARITLSGPSLPLRCGDTLDLPLRLRTPDIYRDPGAWSYSDYLLTEGIAVLATAKSSTVHLYAAPAKPTWHCRLSAAQTWASTRLQTFVDSRPNRLLPAAARLNSEDASMLNAMLFGDRTRLTHALRLGFERTGTFHLFVVSGLHVALLGAGVFWLLRRLRLPIALAVLLTIAITTVYALLTGFGVPVQRALTMTAVYLIAKWLDREITPLNALGLAALAVLVLDPRALTEASFQMTFLVIFAIAGIGAPLSQRLVQPHARALAHLDILRIDAHIHPRLAQFRLRLRMASDLFADLLHPHLRNLPVWLAKIIVHALDAILFSLAAELCMMLPLALYFHRATLLSLPLNVLCIPLVAALLCSAITTFLLSLLSPWLAALPGAATALLLHAVHFAVDHLQRVALADLRTPPPSAIAIALACAAMAFACWSLRKPSRRWLATGIAAIALVPVAILYPTPLLFHPGLLEVTALDVGQGDSLLVISPDGHTLLVDAGGPTGAFGRQTSSQTPAEPRWDVGDEVVAPFLWSRRIRRLDAILLTHAHSDHMGGMPAILRDLHPRELWLSLEPRSAGGAGVTASSPDGNASGPAESATLDSPDLLALLTLARQLHIPIRRLHAGDAFPWNGLTATVLAPEPAYTNPKSPLNDDSLVLRLDLGRASVLLEGDAEAPSEAAMLANHRLAPVTLLKIGHHGSRTSTTPAFLAAVAPQDAVISVGAHNTFGHPRPEILSRLQAAHVKTFRTDRFGAETFLLTPDGGISSQSTASKW